MQVRGVSASETVRFCDEIARCSTGNRAQVRRLVHLRRRPGAGVCHLCRSGAYLRRALCGPYAEGNSRGFVEAAARVLLAGDFRAARP